MAVAGRKQPDLPCNRSQPYAGLSLPADGGWRQDEGPACTPRGLLFPVTQPGAWGRLISVRMVDQRKDGFQADRAAAGVGAYASSSATLSRRHRRAGVTLNRGGVDAKAAHNPHILPVLISRRFRHIVLLRLPYTLPPQGAHREEGPALRVQCDHHPRGSIPGFCAGAAKGALQPDSRRVRGHAGVYLHDARKHDGVLRRIPVSDPAVLNTRR